MRRESFLAMMVNKQILESPKRAAKPSQKWTIWSWLSLFAQGVALAGFLAVLYSFFLPTFRKSEKLRRDSASLNTEVSGLERTRDLLREEVNALTGNPDYIERYARDKLHLAKQGEYVFRFDSYKKSFSQTSPDKHSR